MIYHFGDSSHFKTNTGYSTCHRLHDSVGKILGERRKHKQVNGVVNFHHTLRIIDVTQRVNGYVKLIIKLFGMATNQYHSQLLAHFRMAVHHQLTSINEVIHSLIDIRRTL